MPDSTPFDTDDPWAALATWMAEAEATEPRVPDAMQLATVADGRPSLRTVLLKESGPEGFVFYTNLGSRKADQIAHNPWGAVLLHWKTRERQVHAEGPIAPVDPAVADAYWATRGRGSQIGAWASRQSEPLDARSTLEQRVSALEERFAGQPVPRPEFWSGYVLRPVRLEFWQGRPDRLHDRRVFHATDGGWTTERLHP